MAAGEHDVLRLDVAVDDAGGVCHGERFRGLGQQPHRIRDGQLARAHEPVPQRFAVDVRHHIIEEPAGLARIEHAEYVRMLQPRGDLDLAAEPLGAERRREVGAQHLDRHLAVVLEVFGEIDHRHPALAELALDAVAVGERGGEPVERQRGGDVGSRGVEAPET